MFNRPLAKYPFLILICFISVILLFSWSLEYFFKVLVCSLCRIQQIIYITILVSSFVALIKSSWRPSLLFFMVILFISNIGFAVYKYALENHWIISQRFCKKFLPSLSMKDMENMLFNSNISCDQIAWEFLGESLAFWNICISLLGFLYCCYIFIRKS